MWDDYHIFNRTACIYQAATRWDLPPYRITIWLTDDVTLSFCLLTWWFDSSFFSYSNLRWETGGFEDASTITLVLQANRVTKCASHPIIFTAGKKYFGWTADLEKNLRCPNQCSFSVRQREYKKKFLLSYFRSHITHLYLLNLNNIYKKPDLFCTKIF